MKDWEEASPSVVHVAERLIDQYHPELVDARIGFVFRKEAGRSKGRLVLAQAQTVSPKLQVYLDYDFLIWVSKEDWEGQLTEDQREALIDHELSHCVKNPVSGKWDIRPHDVQEFWHIIERHGLWSVDLLHGRKAMQTAIQGELPMGQVRTGSVSIVSANALRQADGSSDELLEEARAYVEEVGAEISVPKLQRRFSIGFPRAARLLDQIQTGQSNAH